jgi:hypothetical protein
LGDILPQALPFRQGLPHFVTLTRALEYAMIKSVKKGEKQ